MSSYWGIAISRVSFCPKLLGNYTLQGVALLGNSELLGECNFEAPFLRQALGELPKGFALCPAAEDFQLVEYGLPQTIGGVQFPGSCRVSSSCGITI